MLSCLGFRQNPLPVPYLTDVTALAPPATRFVPDRRYSVEEWLAIEEATGERYEYHGGQLVSVRAMAGGTFTHALLIGNVTGQLYTAIRAAAPRLDRCNVLPSDLRLAARSRERYVYPDAAVVCGPPRYDGVVASAVVNPICIVEVISKSSAELDTGDKFEWYAELETLRDYILVDYRRRAVEVRSRATATAEWHTRLVAAPETHVAIPGLDAGVDLGEVYRNWERPKA